MQTPASGSTFRRQDQGGIAQALQNHHGFRRVALPQRCGQGGSEAGFRANGETTEIALICWRQLRVAQIEVGAKALQACVALAQLLKPIGKLSIEGRDGGFGMFDPAQQPPRSQIQRQGMAGAQAHEPPGCFGLARHGFLQSRDAAQQLKRLRLRHHIQHYHAAGRHCRRVQARGEQHSARRRGRQAIVQRFKKGTANIIEDEQAHGGLAKCRAEDLIILLRIRRRRQGHPQGAGQALMHIKKGTVGHVQPQDAFRRAFGHFSRQMACEFRLAHPAHAAHAHNGRLLALTNTPTDLIHDGAAVNELQRMGGGKAASHRRFFQLRREKFPFHISSRLNHSLHCTSADLRRSPAGAHRHGRRRSGRCRCGF